METTMLLLKNIAFHRNFGLAYVIIKENLQFQKVLSFKLL